ncbi:hypothetical protein [Streptomyces sp. NPDC054987]
MVDEVAAVVAGRTVGWRSVGLEVGQVTWRDAEASWPQPLETDRARVHDPDSVGVVISGPGEAASGIASAADFEARMDQWVARVFEVCGGAQ